MKSIDGKQMKELLEKKQASTIDVVSERDFKKNHIKGAANIPHTDRDFVKKVERTVSRKNKNIVLCASQQLGSQLSQLGKELEESGYKNVYEYKAGPSDWKNANLRIQEQT
jgi:rhodanese-related sulfurtransferase